MKTYSPAIFWRNLLFLFLLSPFPAGCTATLPKAHIVGPKTYKGTVDIRINGFRRTYLVHVPSGYSPETPVPLVVVLHGAFDTAEGMEESSGFSLLADRERFIVLYPNGMGILGFLQHWNADDVGFVAATIEDVSARFKVDRDHVYMVGFSNGVCWRSDLRRGEEVYWQASLHWPHGSAENLPMWSRSGGFPIRCGESRSSCFTAYPTTTSLMGGGVNRAKGRSRTYWSVEESVKFWVTRNGCNPQVPVTP